MWLREAGKTKAQQLESAADYNTKTIVTDVYNHRGRSLEVKNAIEQECMQQKDQDRLANQLMLEVQRLKDNNPNTTNIPANRQVQIESPSVETKMGESQNRVKHDDDNKNTTCSSLKDNAERTATERRRGGSAKYMNDLKQRQNEIESAIIASGC